MRWRSRVVTVGGMNGISIAHRPGLRRYAALALAVLCGLVGPLAGTGRAQPGPSASATTDVGIAALSGLATCVRANKQVAVVLLIDESGSLKSTDPLNRRVVAAKSALDSLAGLAEREIDGSRPKVLVSVATFSGDYSTLVPWAELNYTKLGQLTGDIESLTTRNSGLDTDYASALLGAQQALTTQTAVPCRAVMWFTDGRYDIESRRGGALPAKTYAPNARSARDIVDQGKQLICQPKGLADQLRGSQTGNLVVGLTGGLRPADQDFLEALATGSAGSGAAATTCGSVDGRLTGAFLPVNDLSELVASFDAVGALLGLGVQGKPQLDIPVCAQTVCAEGTREFPVDLGMSAVHTSAQVGGNDISVVLRSPEGTITLNNGGQDPRVEQFVLGTTKGRAVWLATDVVTIDVALPAASVKWSGAWALTLVKTTASAKPVIAPGFRTFYYSSISANITTPAASQPTENGDKLAVELIDRPGGSALLPQVVGSMTISMLAGHDDGSVNPAMEATLGAPQGAVFVGSVPSPAAGKNPGKMLVEIRLTTKSGVKLIPTRVSFERAARPVPLVAPRTKTVTTRRAIIIGVALLLSLVVCAAALHLRQRRRTLPPMRNVQVIARPVRVAFDSVGRHRIVWLGQDGAESQFRLSTVTFESTLPTKRTHDLTIGDIRFSKHPPSGDVRATTVGALMMTGPETDSSKLACSVDTVTVPSSFSPMWVFAAELNDEAGAIPGRQSNHRRDRAFDGLMILMINSVDQIPMLERSVLQDLPGLARFQLRSVGNAA